MDEFAFADGKVDVLERLDLAVGGAEFPRHAFNRDF